MDRIETPPDVVIRRLPLYARSLRYLLQEGITSVSSQELGDRIQVTQPRPGEQHVLAAPGAAKVHYASWCSSDCADTARGDVYDFDLVFGNDG